VAVSTGTRAVEDSNARARRWLAATPRLTHGARVPGPDGQGRQGAARERLLVLAAALEPEDPRARGHARRVGALSGRLALAIGLTPDEAEVVALAGVLHDVGTLGAAPEADGADDEDRRHPVIGAQLVAPFDLLALAAPMIRHHHERLDGSGYPDGLRGDTIPIGARIIAVSDEYDRLALAAAHEAALASLAGQARRTLDSSVLAALIDLPLP
jgi:HD-GYP domain-containing protein (c-di-GMP phosphodiesterase class II)